MTTETNTCQSNTCATPPAPARAEAKAKTYVKPQFTARETDGAYEVGVVMPGVPRDGVEVELDKDVLTIAGRTRKSVPEGWKVLHEELSKDDYRLQLSLKFEFDGDGITAKVEDGVLSLRLPVSKAAKPKTISIG